MEKQAAHTVSRKDVFAWKGELLDALNNSLCVTDGASAGEHAQLQMTGRSCQNIKAEPLDVHRNRICGNSAAPTSPPVLAAKMCQSSRRP